MNKRINPVCVGFIILLCSNTAFSSLAPNATLLFDPSVFGCPSVGTPPCIGELPVVTGGTFYSFDFDNNGNIELFERQGMTPKNGIKLGIAQPASGSHPGSPDGSEITDIDKAFTFFGNTGMHFTDTPVTVISDDGAGNVALDMSGWSITWNGLDVNFGSGSWGSNPEGQALLTCSTDCSVGDTFTLFYTATVQDGPFLGVRYRLGFDGGTSLSGFLANADSDLGAPMTGIIQQTVPLPAAVWLFGSGIIVLLGLGRRKA